MNGGMTLSSFKRPIALLKLKTFGEHNGEVSSFLLMALIHSCRVIILVRSDLDFNPRIISYEDEARSIIIETVVQGSPFLFVSIFLLTRFKTNAVF